MRRIVFLLLILLISLPVLAQDATEQITAPQPNTTVQGLVDVTGTVNPPDLQSYFFEVADASVDPNTATWTPITLPSRTPVTNGTITQLNTTIVADGTYTLRLRVVHTTGQTTVVNVGPLTFANNGATINTTSATATPAAPAQPTIIPRPTVTNTLPVPVGGQLESFDENAATLMQQAGMTWAKWQIPFSTDDSSLIDVVRDRINWSHQHGFFAFLSFPGKSVDELTQQGADFYPKYAQFLGQVAALQPDAIEVWNEMNLDREWPTGKIDPRAYVEMLHQAHDAIKAVDPSIMVVSGALAPTGAEGAFGLDRVWNDDRYYLGMANAGAAQYADCIGIHYNEGVLAPDKTSGDPRSSDYPTYFFQSMMQRALNPFKNSNLPLCYSELGYVSPEGFGGALPAGFEWGNNTTVQDQAQWLAQAVQIAAQTGKVKLMIVYNINLTQSQPDPQAQYAIIRPDKSCPACQTLAALKSG